MRSALLIAAAAFVPGMAVAQDCDVAILNGRVMDPETGFDAVANVCIAADRIVAITESEISGGEMLDVSGHVVAPGFINTHSHSFAPFEQAMMARDGTTTLLDIEVGVANVPFFYDRYSGNSLLNYGVGVSHEEVRRVVMDGLTEAEILSQLNLNTFSSSWA